QHPIELGDVDPQAAAVITLVQLEVISGELFELDLTAGALHENGSSPAWGEGVSKRADPVGATTASIRRRIFGRQPDQGSTSCRVSERVQPLRRTALAPSPRSFFSSRS